MDTKQLTFHWGKWVHSEEPTTGVVSMNSLEWIDDAIDYGDKTVNLTYEASLQEYLEEQFTKWENEHNGDLFCDLPEEERLEQIDQWTMEFNDSYDGMGEEEYLIGDWARNKETNDLYAPDHNGEYAAIALCGSNVVIVEWSRYATRCALCSPCYPGSGDLDTPGEFLTYDLPLEMYGEYRDNPNPQVTLSAPEEAQEEPS